MISGGSAGGYTTQRALTPEHKFESRYLDWLIGPYSQEQQTYADRSPLSAPVIFFQGAEDKFVPPNQTELMVIALKSRGIPVGYFLFDGEQHGFRKAQNIQRALDAEVFLRRAGPAFGTALLALRVRVSIHRARSSI